MDTENKSAAGLWADLWEVYMRENRALRARAEALEARAAQARAEGEAAGYRRATDDACAAIVALYADEGASVYKSERAHGRWAGLESAEQAVRALAPVEPVSPADGLPGGAA